MRKALAQMSDPAFRIYAVLICVSVVVHAACAVIKAWMEE